ncbi:phytanoyl-CoA dioxygenase family protein [Ectothiorhodospiraceae bacterium 2226]|nr:phytanoyl-CoA dioxygenase family protein [Ectothiorhodospiraceae bacterium 2226]
MSALPVTPHPSLTDAQRAQFEAEGYLILRALVGPAEVARLRALAGEALARAEAPLEYEAQVGYPGAPASLDAPGGRTVRRLLQAYARHPAFAARALDPLVGEYLHALLGSRPHLAQAHHNCIMTKHPGYSSATLWHQDVRYWQYARPELISAWLALGRERPENGCLYVLPGTHRVPLARERFDDALFLRTDLPENQPLIDSRVAVELEPGDVLLFHARTLHAAGANRTDEVKLSLVFTYRGEDNAPLPGTRSASLPEVVV